MEFKRVELLKNQIQGDLKVEEREQAENVFSVSGLTSAWFCGRQTAYNISEGYVVSETSGAAEMGTLHHDLIRRKLWNGKTRVYDREIEIDIQHNGKRLVGHIDGLFKDQYDKKYLLEIKTVDLISFGKKDEFFVEKYKEQIIIYLNGLLLLKKINYQDTANCILLIYCRDNGNIKEIELNFDTQELGKLGYDIAEKKFAEIENKHCNKSACRFCRHTERCSEETAEHINSLDSEILEVEDEFLGFSLTSLKTLGEQKKEMESNVKETETAIKQIQENVNEYLDREKTNEIKEMSTGIKYKRSYVMRKTFDYKTYLSDNEISDESVQNYFKASGYVKVTVK